MTDRNSNGSASLRLNIALHKLDAHLAVLENHDTIKVDASVQHLIRLIHETNEEMHAALEDLAAARAAL